MSRAGIVIGIVVVLIGVVLAADLALDLIVEEAIETLGPAITGTSVELDDVGLSILDGTGKIEGLIIGNPRGFKTKYAFRLREIRVHLVPMTIFRDKIVLREIRINEPSVNFEQKDGNNNLEGILRHMQSALGGSGDADGETDGNDTAAIWEQLTEQEVQIDHFLMKDAAVHASGFALEGKPLDAPPITVELEGLGTGSDGQSVARVSAKVMRHVANRVTLAVTKRMLTLGLGGRGESAKSERGQKTDGDANEEAPRRRKRRRQ